VLYRRETLYVNNWRENLLTWLNGEIPTRYYSRPARRRIEGFITALQTLIRRRLQFRPLSTKTPGRLLVQMPKDAFHSIRIVQRVIERYPSWPVLMWDPENNLSFGEDFRGMGAADQEEAEAVHSAMRLAEVNELTSLARCPCGRWFFAIRRTQRSCSSNCRHRLYEQTEQFKAKRRKYMRQYYRLQHSGKVR
jgi:hypothetical protein